MKRILSSLYIWCAFAALLSAQPQVQMDKMRHEFGSVIWKEPAQATFLLTNRGDMPLRIENVHPDCGCTEVLWSNKEVAPGQSTELIVRLDAELLGYFEKQIYVMTNADTDPFYLTVTGNVVRERRAVKGNFPYQIGDIHLNSDNIEFDDVHTGEYPRRELQVYNAGRQSYTPELMHLPKYITAKCEPAVIRPGRTGTITLTLDSEQVPRVGVTHTTIYLSRFQGDRISRDNELVIFTTLLPEQTFTAAQMANAPVMQLSTQHLDLGRLNGKKKAKGKIFLSNTGKSDLEISALQVYNPGLTVSIPKRVIKPGEKVTMKIEINAGEGSQYFKGRRSILLLTNDPANPKVVIDVRVEK